MSTTGQRSQPIGHLWCPGTISILPADYQPVGAIAWWFRSVTGRRTSSVRQEKGPNPVRLPIRSPIEADVTSSDGKRVRRPGGLRFGVNVQGDVLQTEELLS
jgi:hypothetical protein